MKRFIALALAAVAAMFVLVGCTADSSSGVVVIGDNVAKLPAGETMVLHRNSGKSGYTWFITYDGGSTVHFFKDNIFDDDNIDIELLSSGETKFDPGWGALNMWVSRNSDTAVAVRWEDGLVFQPYEG